MINPNYMTHLDHVVRIIIVCRVLTEKMRSGKFQASVASYIESYNTQRPHRTLKNLTPCQVEENSIEKAEWDIRVRTAWFFRFLCQIEAVWVFVSHIYLTQHFQKTLLCQGFQSIKQPHQIRKSHRLVRIEWGRSRFSVLQFEPPASCDDGWMICKCARESVN